MLQSSTYSAKDAGNRAELTVLIEKLTTSGQPVLDENQLKSLKRICRLSDDYVRHVFHMLMTRLNKHHAEVRLSAFQICEELFVRSHCFRDLLLSEMQNFVKLVLEVDAKHPLPPPKKAAVELQRLAKKSMKNWYDKFGLTYKKLALCYNYLLKNKQIDFSSDQSTVAQQQRENLRLQKLQALNEHRLNRTLKEIEDLSEDINVSVSEAESCIELLIESAGLFEDNDFCSTESVNSVSYDTKVKNTTDLHIDMNVDEPEQQSCHGSGDNGISVTGAGHQSSANNANMARLLGSQKNANKAEDLVSSHTLDQAMCFSSAIDDSVAAVKSESHCIANFSTENCSKLNETCSNNEQHSSITDIEMCFGTRDHGLHSHGPTLQIDVAKKISIQETEDNLVLIRNLQDQYSLLSNRYLPTVKKWLEVLAKVGASENQVKMAVDVKTVIESTLQKIIKLNVSSCKTQSMAAVQLGDDDENSDSEDFEEVPNKDGYEDHVPLHLLREARCNPASWPSVSAAGSNVSYLVKDRHGSAEDPTTCSALLLSNNSNSKLHNYSPVTQINDCSEECQPSTSGIRKMSSCEVTAEVPIVPYGFDLLSWGEKVDAPLLASNNPDTNWWSKAADDTIDVHAVQASKSRVIDFSGSYAPVKWKCRAPLADGSLCSRMDRVKCPFHGKIIARDEKGRVQQQSSISASVIKAPTVNSSKPDDWDDPELQADIQAATGLTLCRKGRGGKKGKQPKEKTKNGLTDIRLERKNTARKRLEEKVLSRSATKRVANALDNLQSKMIEKKFGSSFKYTFRT